MNTRNFAKRLVILTLLGLLAACGGGGGGGGSAPLNPAPAGVWDTMMWDQGNWG